MRYRNLILPALTALLMTSAGSAAVIIDSSTLNGSFESDDGSGTASQDFQFADWTTGFNVVNNQRLNDNPTNGTWSAVIGAENVTAAKIGLLQNTGYTVGLGDTFDLSFDWADAYNWDDDIDTIDWRLFTTDDNTDTGVVTTVVASVSISDNSDDANLSYQSESWVGTGTVVAASVGQQLWLEIYSASAGIDEVDGTNGEFARIDNVQLTAVPEPATYALLGGFFALGFVLLRRRLRG